MPELIKTQTHLQRNAQSVYILFADLKEYSANKHDLSLILKMETALYDIGHALFPETKHCFKVLGDGMLATDQNPVSLAQKALQIIDQIQSTFAADDAFKAKPQIRIALHRASAQHISERYLTYDLGQVQLPIFKDIAGEEVINTARIEPVVKPNHAFCSAAFAQDLQQLKTMGFNPDLETAPLDTFALGKSHDSFEVELHVVYAQKQVPNLDELRQHIREKLDRREETYQAASPLTAAYLNQGLQIGGDMMLQSNVLKGNTIHTGGGNITVGDGHKTEIQNADKIINIGKINKAEFN
ncbi:MAG: hypothetical protein HC913_09890 [Microscillaceae bacterium]|nr:hypothetical protein [Microscillaceae bacterium]